MAARKKQPITEYLGNAPKKSEIVELIYNMQSCLLWNSEQSVSKKAIEDKLIALSSNVLPPYFHFAVFPKWLYMGFLTLETTYKGFDVTPNFGEKSGMWMPFSHEGTVNPWYLIHFKESEKHLPDQAFLDKVLKSTIYRKWLVMVEPAAYRYIKAKFVFLADAHSHKGTDAVERVDDFYTCAKFVFYQTYLAGLYCYLTDLERGDSYVQQYNEGNYHQQRKNELNKTLGVIKILETQIKGGSQGFDFHLPYSKEQWKLFADSRWKFEQELDWYSLFGKIGDTYFETAFVFRMIGSLLNHGLNKEVAAKIVHELSASLRGELAYGKLINDKVKRYVCWHQNQINEYGMDQQQHLVNEFNEEFDQESMMKILICMLLDLTRDDSDEANRFRDECGVRHCTLEFT